MSTAPTRHVWDALGRPGPVESAAAHLGDAGTCRMCGHADLPTADARRALGENWTDHTCWRRTDSSRVCTACLWVCSGRPPATIRMWTVLTGTDHTTTAEKAPWRDGALLTNRGRTRPVIDALAAPPGRPWLLSVAMSGQKHILPYGVVNPGGHGTFSVRMEDTTITATPQEWRHVHRHALALRRLGVRDPDILIGQPGAHLKTVDQVDTWRHHAHQLTTHTRSPLLTLALWTITKEITQDDDTRP